MLHHLITFKRGGRPLADPAEHFLDRQINALHRSGEGTPGLDRISPCEGLPDHLGKSQFAGTFRRERRVGLEMFAQLRNERLVRFPVEEATQQIVVVGVRFHARWSEGGGKGDALLHAFPEGDAEPFERLADGGWVHRKLFGDVLGRMFLLVAALEKAQALFGQPADAFFQRVEPGEGIVAHFLRFVVVRRGGGNEDLGEVVRENAFAARVLAPLVDHEIARDAAQPSAEIARAVEFIKAVVGHDEGLLRHIIDP